MSDEYHYVRTLGDDGGVEVCDGPAIGIDLTTVLRDGLPPWKVALEIVAAVCEMLDIAEEDGEVHGDLTPSDVFIDDTGAVSIEGFGKDRNRTRAPEGSPRGSATDLYGLGYTAYALFCESLLPDNLPVDDPDAHDDAIIDAVLLVDLEGVPEEMQGDIQWFLAKLLSFDREDRPSAVEAWRTFIAFADAVQGPDFVGWCTQALEGGGTRRGRAAGASGGLPASLEEEEEDLGGPVMRSGPLTKGAISFDGGGAAKGQATAFWSKDAMKAALERAEVADDSYRPQQGGGSATGFWSKDEMDAMREGKKEAPRPKRSSKRSETMMMARPRQPLPEEPATTPPMPGGPSQAPPPERNLRQPPPTPPLQVSRPPTGQSGRASSPGWSADAGAGTSPRPEPRSNVPVERRSTPVEIPAHQGRGSAADYPVVAPPRPMPEPEPEGGGSKALLLGGTAMLLLVGTAVCLGIGGVGGAWVLLTGQDRNVPIVEATPPAPPPRTGGDTDTPGGGEATPAPSPSPKPGPKPSPVSPKPSPKPTPVSPKPAPVAPKPAPVAPKPAPVAPKPAPAPTPPPAPAPTGGPAKVMFGSNGRGSLQCAGITKNFDGPTTVTIEEYQLPATCLVTIEKQRTVFQVYGTGEVSCNLEGSAVVCNRSQVP